MKNALALLLVTFSLVTRAQFVNDPALNTVVQDLAGYEEAVPLSALSGSNSLMTYFTQNNNGSYDFNMQVMDGSGINAFQPTGLTVSNYPQSTAIFKYDMTTDKDGGIVAAFQDERTGVLDVVAYRMSASGAFLWGNAGVQLNDPAGSSGIGPGVGVLTNGSSVVAWNVDGSPKDWIAFQIISPTGTLLSTGTPFRIIDSTNTVTYKSPQIIPMQNGDFMICYLKQAGNFFPGTNTIYVQRFNSSGQPVWASGVNISTKSTSGFAFPSVVSDGNNGAYIAFETSNPVSLSINDVFVQHIDMNGALWSTDGTDVASGANTQRMSPVIRFEGTMPYPVVMVKETDLSQSYSGVMIQAFDPATGTASWLPDGVPVRPVTTVYDEPYDMRDFCGGLIMLYAEGGFGNNSMTAIKTDYNGIPTWPGTTVTLSSVPSNKLRGQLTPEIAIGPMAEVVAIWEDERSGRGIYAQNIWCDGTLGPNSVGITPVTSTDFSAGVYPNPSAGDATLRIQSTRNTSARVSMYDAMGRLVMSENDIQLTSGLNEIRLSELTGFSRPAAGVYHVSFTSESGTSDLQWIVK